MLEKINISFILKIKNKMIDKYPKSKINLIYIKTNQY